MMMLLTLSDCQDAARHSGALHAVLAAATGLHSIRRASGHKHTGLRASRFCA